MGGEGSMAATNNSLKNNRNLLAKRKDKKALSGSYAKIERKEFPKPTKQQLSRIKERLKRENNVLRNKRILAFVFALSALLLFYYLLFY